MPLPCPRMLSNLEDIHYAINFRNWDWLHINWGIEGSGKSAFGIYCCTKIDPSFDIDNIVFNLKEFKERVKVAKPGTALMMDEAGQIAFSRDWNTAESKEFVKNTMLLRVKGLFLWMNIPDFKYVDVYVRAGRLRSMTQTYTISKNQMVGDKVRYYRERGFFHAFTRKRVMAYFNRNMGLRPSFSERYPDVSKTMPELWARYEEKAERMKNIYLYEQEAVKVDGRKRKERVIGGVIDDYKKGLQKEHTPVFDDVDNNWSEPILRE